MNCSGLRVLCYGDSNTFGHDPRSFIGDRYPDNVRWTGLLARAGMEIVNLGQNGRQIPSGPAELYVAEMQLASHSPADVLLVMLGTNDLVWNPDFRAEDAAERMRAFLPRAAAAVPGASLLLVAPPPMEPGEWVKEERLLSESRRLGELYCGLDLGAGDRVSKAGEWGVALGFDGVHFTAEGHEAFYRGVEPILEQIAAERELRRRENR